MARHQYQQGIIGNCAYLAHINNEADVSWMCWPKFDSSFIFGNLLDDEKGGHFYIKPHHEEFETHQYYIPNTNILCTEFNAPDGKFRITDLAPRFRQYGRHFKPLMLFRKIEPLEGNPEIVISCNPKGDYGQVTPEAYIGSNHIRFLGLKKPVRLTSSLPLSYILSERSIFLNTTNYLCLSWGIPLEAPLESTADEFLQKTKEYWQDFVNQSAIGNFHQKAVIRSILALKLHQFEDTGAIIASSTSSLPEYPDQGRNWDYRYCWLRDSYYTLMALNNIGHFYELQKYAFYIQNLITREKSMNFQPVYTLVGDKDKLPEETLDLKGYLGNQPVRRGNQAYTHVQNDVYGQILISLLPLYSDERFAEKDEGLAIRLTSLLLDKIEEKIDEPDAGLWEFRETEQLHCYSSLFHWAGSNAALKIANHFGHQSLAKKAKKLIKHAETNIEACYDDKEQVYRQAADTQNLDASLLQLITMKYLDPRSEKAQNHLKKLEEELMTEEGLFFRYKHEDDFGKPKSAFLVCAYWYVDALACVGRLQDAQQVFERLYSYSNHLGLISEDVDPEDGSQWGNFPQAYSHMGLVNAAFRIAHQMDEPDFLPGLGD